MKTRHRIFLLLLAVSVPLSAALALGAEWLLLRDVEQRLEERLRSDLRLLSSLLKEPAAWSGPLDGLADAWGRALGVRVTLVDAGGKVLGDSTVDGVALGALENHAGRPEIAAAGVSGFGEARRFSTTRSERMLYLATAVRSGARRLGYIRLAIAEREILARGREHRSAIILMFSGGVTVFAGVGYLASRRLARPFELLAAAAELEAAPESALPSQPPGDSGAATEEARRLAASIRRMHASLVASLAQATAEREQLHSILTGMREGILVVSHERRVLLSNRALVEILQLPLAPEPGAPLALLIRDPTLLDAFERCCARGENVSETVTLGGVAGRSYEVRVQPHRPAGSPHGGAIGVFFDVTQLQALEKVRRDFIVNVSHELRTPLTAIRAFVETLQEGALEEPEHSREFLGIIRRHCDRMQALINDLTDLSLIETGAVRLDLQQVDVAAVTREAFVTLRPRSEAHQTQMQSCVPAELRARADPQRLEQILLNLLENAIKFNRPGGRVRVEAVRLPRGVQIVVSDTGGGIPSDHLEKIFHRFHRVDPSRSREQGGTGLGLAIVKHLVRLHGGSIRAESEMGRGSRFILELPAE